jgi:hypothetical protein
MTTKLEPITDFAGVMRTLDHFENLEPKEALRESHKFYKALSDNKPLNPSRSYQSSIDMVSEFIDGYEKSLGEGER